MKQKCHILLVEDDPFLRNFLSAELAEHGYIVTVAENGLKALNNSGPMRMDVILTDIFMPGMDGIELIRRLRKLNPNLPIFAMSGVAHHRKPEDYLRYAKRFGADEVFVKPVDVALLLSKLESYCQ